MITSKHRLWQYKFLVCTNLNCTTKIHLNTGILPATFWQHRYFETKNVPFVTRKISPWSVDLTFVVKFKRLQKITTKLTLSMSSFHGHTAQYDSIVYLLSTIFNYVNKSYSKARWNIKYFYWPHWSLNICKKKKVFSLIKDDIWNYLY